MPIGGYLLFMPNDHSNQEHAMTYHIAPAADLGDSWNVHRGRRVVASYFASRSAAQAWIEAQR